MLFIKFAMTVDLLDPYFGGFRRFLHKQNVFQLDSVSRPREYVGTCRNPRIRFYRLVRRVRTLRVSARRLGALI